MIGVTPFQLSKGTARPLLRRLLYRRLNCQAMAPFCLGQRLGRRDNPADPYNPEDSSAGITNDIGRDAAGVQGGRLQGPPCTIWPAGIGMEKASALSPPRIHRNRRSTACTAAKGCRFPDSKSSGPSRCRTRRQAFLDLGIAASRLRDAFDAPHAPNPLRDSETPPSAFVWIAPWPGETAWLFTIAAHTSHHAS